MFLEPFSYRFDGAFIGRRTRMRTVKHSNFVKQENANPRTFRLRNFSTQTLEQRLNICPTDITRQGMSKNSLKRFLVFASHLWMVSYSATNNNKLTARRKTEACCGRFACQVKSTKILRGQNSIRSPNWIRRTTAGTLLTFGRKCKKCGELTTKVTTPHFLHIAD